MLSEFCGRYFLPLIEDACKEDCYNVAKRYDINAISILNVNVLRLLPRKITAAFV